MPPILNTVTVLQEWLKVECILDKNITMTPDAEETDHLIADTSYPPPYRPNYVSVTSKLSYVRLISTLTSCR